MSEKLKIISLGGLNEIGKNLTVLEYGRDIIVVDCGMGFPEDDMYGIDSVIADTSYLVKNKDKIRGMFITHGHEDHIGGIPYAMQNFKTTIHGTRLTLGLVKRNMEEFDLDQKVKQAANFIKKYENDAVMYKNMYEKALEEEEKLQEELQKYLEELQKKLNSKYVGGTFMWPVPLDYTRVSSAYGWRINPITGKNELHNGIDIPAAYGTYIYAANAGKVTISSDLVLYPENTANVTVTYVE